MSADTNKLILKANLPRTRDLSFVGRFAHNYGFEDRLFQYLLSQKDLWGDKVFYLDEKQFFDWVTLGKHEVREVPATDAEFPDMAVEDVLADEFYALFGPIDAIDIDISKGGVSAQHNIATGESVPLKAQLDRNAVATNVGGYVTSMKWLPYGESPMLAVSVINSTGGLADAISEPSLSVFPKKNLGDSIKSAIQLWKYDSQACKLTLSQVLDTSAFGGTSNIQWLPLRFRSDALGVLSGVFTDGKLHFFKFVNTIAEEATFAKVIAPAWTIALTDERRSEQELLPITCFDFLGCSKVIVGTLDGAIAEFVLPLEEDADDLSIPSFLEYLVDSCVTTVATAEVNGSNVILVNTATTQGFAIIYEQLRQGRVETNFTISTLKPVYHRGYRLFVYPDSAESIGYTFVRHPHQKHSLLLKTELVTAFHTSEFLSHPLAIVGNSCGDVYVINIGRKIFGVPKAHNKLLVPLKLWSLQKTEEKYKLIADYVPSAPDKNDVMYTFTPPEVAISATAWNESFDGSSTYAFGTYTGLLVLERLDPAYC